ncbi:molybdopterin converting factor subunit 1 [Herbaspirillum robiniae]|uniref:Molybdopterin converting factor subunit 1 n=1 Tax=Herbaspirillum robiniae TaxID=2014887 RepID=A0A246WX05_9BURK|nr:molybdopterin converting factor subunit 1 [Herbaspirillum robiniae]NUU00138.1 molybdopterin converting factor subunit 1 [Herbaspirillum robiniae]OWY30886.1 molybdopterin converting factor subunit 1 [Herbaspirillum robiniae]
MKIELRFFASVREALKTSTEVIDVPASVKTVGDVRAFLIGRGGSWAEVLGPEKNLRMAYDHVMTEADTEIVEGGEVAFFPPVTGG